MAMCVSTLQPVKPNGDARFRAFHSPLPTAGHTLRQVSTPQLIKRRDAMVWRLSGFEHEIAAHNLERYWQILDEMMEVSVDSAVQVVAEAYGARFRRLPPHEQRREYPGVRQHVYRMASFDRRKPHEDFTSGTLVEHALEVLQEQAYALL